MRRLLAVAGVLALTLTACGSGDDAADDSGAASAVKIGFFSPMTGPTSQDGIDARHGAELAVEELNKQGKRTYTLAAYDDGGDPAQAVTLARKLVQSDKVSVVVSGAYSPTTAAAAPIFQQFKIPMLSAYAVSPKITAAGNYVFRAGPAGSAEGAAAAVFIKEKLHGNPQKIAIIEGDSEALSTLASSMKAKAQTLGLNVVADRKFALSDSDYRPLLQNIGAASPDVVYLTGYYDSAAAILNQMAELGIKAPVMMATVSDSPELFKLVKGSGMEGRYMTTDFPRGGSGPVKDFAAAYQAKFNAAPSMVGASAYDAIKAAAAAVDKADSTNGEKLRDAIAGLKDLDQLVTGPVSEVTAERDFARPIHLVVVKDGAWTDFAQVPWAEVSGG
jgi:branched-chain amino acid transport system substrate-binding protein